MTKEQIIKDWEIADWGSTKEKKEVAARYNFASTKGKDLKLMLAQEMAKLRKSCKNFTDEDLMWFARLEYNQKTLKTLLMNEPTEFIKLFIATMQTRAKRGGNSIAGKYARKNAEIAQDALNELTKTPEMKAKENAESNLINELRSILADKMKNFKTEFLARVKENSSKYYDSLPSLIEKYTKALQKEREYVENICKEKKLRGYQKWSYEDGVRKIERKLGNFKAILRRFTKNEFVDDCLKNAEKQYEYNLDALTARINEKKLNISKIEISNVKEDPKLFEMLITDGTKKLYCRSIIAAQWSEKVTTHFRFIMTERH